MGLYRRGLPGPGKERSLGSGEGEEGMVEKGEKVLTEELIRAQGPGEALGEKPGEGLSSEARTDVASPDWPELGRVGGLGARGAQTQDFP